MKIFENNFLTPDFCFAINLFGMMFVKKGDRNLVTEQEIRHEKIHTEQMKELLYFPFYIWYLVEWGIKIVKYGDVRVAYYNISFEKEAYKNDWCLDYLEKRKRYNWINLLKK